MQHRIHPLGCSCPICARATGPRRRELHHPARVNRTLLLALFVALAGPLLCAVLLASRFLPF